METEIRGAILEGQTGFQTQRANLMMEDIGHSLSSPVETTTSMAAPYPTGSRSPFIKVPLLQVIRLTRREPPSSI